MRLALAVAALVAIAGMVAEAAPPPRRMLWAWYSTKIEAPLPEGYGVAFSILSLHLTGTDEVKPFLRRGALPLPAGTYRMGVVRIEFSKALFTDTQRAIAAKMIAEAVKLTGISAIQIDFDAPKSAWPFYTALLRDVRGRIPRDVFLSVTALASWCGAKTWLQDAVADELVPMLFEMGPVKPVGEFAFGRCGTSSGVSLLEPVQINLKKRVYIFPGKSNWTEANIKQAVRSYPP